MRKSIIVVGITAALTLAACGSSSNTNDEPAAETQPTQTSSSESAPSEDTSSDSPTSAEEPADDADSDAAWEKAEADPDVAAMVPDTFRDKGSISNANTLAYPPLEYVDDDGELAGLNLDLVRAMGKVLDIEIDTQQVPFENQIPGLVAHRYDIAFTTFADTEERRKQVDFVDFMEGGIRVSVTSDNPLGIQGFEDLCGVTVGTNKGTMASEYVTNELTKECEDKGEPAPDLNVFPDQPSVVLALTNGRIQARIDDATTTSYYAEQSQGAVISVGEARAIDKLGMAIAKDNTELAKAAQAAIQKLIDSGVYLEILTEHGQEMNAIPEATINAGN